MVLSVHNNFARVISFILIITIILLVFFGIKSPLDISNMRWYLCTDRYLSDFDIFPEKDKINGEVIEYHYRNSDLSAIAGHEVYLEVVYSPEAFAGEINRLENVKHIVSKFNYEHTIIQDDRILFNFVTYISTYNYDGQYEYACVDYDDLRITYILLRDMKIEDISFDSIYLPKTYYINEENFSHYDDYNTDPYFFDMYSVTTDENMPDYLSMDSVEDELVINTVNRYSAYKLERDYSGESSGITNVMYTETDFDHTSVKCKEMTGIITLSSTKCVNSTIELNIDSTITSGDAKIVVIKDGVIIQNISIAEMSEIIISSTQESTIVVKLISFDARDVEINVDREAVES